jgi:hypothetical protein
MIFDQILASAYQEPEHANKELDANLILTQARLLENNLRQVMSKDEVTLFYHKLEVEFKQEYVRTVSGQIITFRNIKPDQIKIEDIAYHLAGIPRFCGGTRPRYTVGQHSIACTKVDNFSRQFTLALLLHDAEEYIFQDVPAPIKPFVVSYTDLANNAREIILAKFGALKAYREYSGALNSIDKKMYRTECAQLRTHKYGDDVYPIELKYQDPADVEREFLEIYYACH